MTPTTAQLTAWRSRDYSWSQHSTFLWNKQDWFNKYILDLPQRKSAELDFGKTFADSCESSIPLAPVTLLSKVEYPFKVAHDGITLIGYADTLDDNTFKHIGEFKTGVKPWDQKRVDEHHQITLYAFMNFIQNKIRPEDVRLFLEWIPTKKTQDANGFNYSITFASDPPEVIHFETKRTMADVLRFGSDIKRVRAEMEEYVALKS